MPQISQILETYASQAFWMLITFGIIYFVIAKSMLPKITSNIDVREQKIASDLAAAEKARAVALDAEGGSGKTLVDARAEVQAKAAVAKAKAAKDSEARCAKADAEIADKLSVAEAAIAKAQAKAMSEVDAVATDAAADLVAKIGGLKVTTAEAGKAVKLVMAHG